MYYVYILKCSDQTLYTGITADLDRRLNEHNQGRAGAKYTYARRPVELVYYKKYKTRSAACREEAKIKKLPRGDKLKLIS